MTLDKSQIHRQGIIELSPLGKGKRRYYAARADLALKQGDLFRLIKYRELAEQLEMEGEMKFIVTGKITSLHEVIIEADSRKCALEKAENINFRRIPATKKAQWIAEVSEKRRGEDEQTT